MMKAFKEKEQNAMNPSEVAKTILDALLDNPGLVFGALSK
jgi:hypothetical protein